VEKKENRQVKHGSKLKNEQTARDYYGKSLRSKKVDTRLTEKEIRKSKQLKQQSMIAARQFAGKAAEAVQDASDTSGREESCNNTEVAQDAISETGYVLETSIGAVASKIKGSKYGNRIHDRKGKTAETKVSTNRMKKEMQKKAAEKTRKEAESVGKVGKKLTDKAEDMIGKIGEMLIEFIQDNPTLAFTIIVILLLLVFICGTFSSCGAFAGTGQNVTIATTYTAEDEDILNVDDDYTELEEGIQDEIDDIESDYPGYDEYVFTLDEIGHNPYQLAAILTVIFEDYTRDEVQAKLQEILDLQYEISIEEEVETREREVEDTRWVEDDSYAEGGYYEDYTYTEEYEYYILNVTLTNHTLDEVVHELGLTDDQLERYEILLATYGNKKYLFEDDIYSVRDPGELGDYLVPGEYLTDEEFARMMREAERYLGMDYVWGGYSPTDGFDCSGFVSYVINHCGNGWDVGRQTANGLKNMTARVDASDVKPGDLVFFRGTYNTSGASHVGIVVDPVNKIMIHAGNPIKYSCYDTNYWRSHAYCYGRINH